MDSTNFYFIQEYLEGKQLLDYIQDIHLTEKVVVEILKKLVSISMYLTNMGFQFTDLKPHCIFMCDDGKTMKVTDFDYKCTFDKESYSTNRYGSVYFVCPEVIDRMHNEDWLVWN
jgi:serine/threonine protein kinase